MISTLASIILAAVTMATMLLLTAAAQRRGATDAQLLFMLVVTCGVTAWLGQSVAADLGHGAWPLMSWVMLTGAFLVACKRLYPMAQVARFPALSRPSRRRYGWSASPLPVS